MIKKFYSPLLLPLFLFPFFATAQAQSISDSHIQSPVMLLRLSPTIASESRQAINHYIATQITCKKRLLSDAFIKGKEIEINIGSRFWGNLSYPILQEFNRSGEVSNANNFTTCYNNKGSALTADPSFDVTKANLGAMSSNLGAVGGDIGFYASVYNTFGVSVEYNALNPLSLGSKEYYPLQLVADASADNSPHSVQLQAGYSF